MSKERLPKVRGWCPGAWQPMQSGDGWILRLRPPLGRLSPEQARELAALGVRYGNGLFDLTSRGALQIRGLAEAGIAPLQQALVVLGLMEEDPVREDARNVLLSPLWQPGDATHRSGMALEEALGESRLRLPDKFGFSIDFGAQPTLGQNLADIRLERAASGQLVCRPADVPYARPVQLPEAAAVAIDLAKWFLASGGARRMKALLEQGAPLPEGYAPFTPAAPAGAPIPGPLDQGLLVAFAFGQMSAWQLEALAGHAVLRLTPWRMLLLEGVQHLPAIEGVITNADNPLRRVIACTGAPACPQAHGPTRALAVDLAPLVPEHARLHISGCRKSCASAHPASVTLVAVQNGGYDLIRSGHASRDAPEWIAVPEEVLPGLLHQLLHEE